MQTLLANCFVMGLPLTITYFLISPSGQTEPAPSIHIPTIPPWTPLSTLNSTVLPDSTSTAV